MVLFDSSGRNYILGPRIDVSTRKNRPIPNEQRTQTSPVLMEEYKAQFLTHHPACSVRSLSSVYNCMGLVFASRRTWIDPESLGIILEDDAYRQLNAQSELEFGDLVVYRAEETISHVGIVARVDINLREGIREVLVLSQWGKAGEYFHKIDDVPHLLGQPKDYWTDRI